MDALAILLGGALGGMARFWLADLISRRWGSGFPLGILLVNASGALLAGATAAAGLAASTIASFPAAPLVVTGFLGSYTTVSSFSLQTAALLHDGAAGRAAANILASLGLVLGGVGLGWALTARLLEAAA